MVKSLFLSFNSIVFYIPGPQEHTDPNETWYKAIYVQMESKPTILIDSNKFRIECYVNGTDKGAKVRRLMSKKLWFIGLLVVWFWKNNGSECKKYKNTFDKLLRSMIMMLKFFGWTMLYKRIFILVNLIGLQKYR